MVGAKAPKKGDGEKRIKLKLYYLELDVECVSLYSKVVGEGEEMKRFIAQDIVLTRKPSAMEVVIKSAMVEQKKRARLLAKMHAVGETMNKSKYAVVRHLMC